MVYVRRERASGSEMERDGERRNTIKEAHLGNATDLKAKQRQERFAEKESRGRKKRSLLCPFSFVSLSPFSLSISLRFLVWLFLSRWFEPKSTTAWSRAQYSTASHVPRIRFAVGVTRFAPVVDAHVYSLLFFCPLASATIARRRF